MDHNFLECADPVCLICDGYEEGCRNTCEIMLYVRDHGKPPGLALCDGPCRHERCQLIWTLDYLYRQSPLGPTPTTLHDGSPPIPRSRLMCAARWKNARDDDVGGHWGPSSAEPAEGRERKGLVSFHTLPAGP